MLQLEEHTSTSALEAHHLRKLLAAAETRAKDAARRAQTLFTEFGQSSAALDQMESELQHLLMVVSEEAVSLQMTKRKLKSQVASLEAANRAERSARQDYHVRLTSANRSIDSLTSQRSRLEQQLQSAKADHRAVARYLALSKTNVAASMQKLRQCEEEMSASEARLAAFRLAANSESSKLTEQFWAAQASQSQAARDNQELQHQLEALRAALARSQQDRATMVSSDTSPEHHLELGVSLSASMSNSDA